MKLNGWRPFVSYGRWARRLACLKVDCACCCGRSAPLNLLKGRPQVKLNPFWLPEDKLTFGSEDEPKRKWMKAPDGVS
ncbi:MAG: hypothetical protein ACTS4T_00665 [Candidatus Hodgkinia cicadicola]